VPRLLELGVPVIWRAHIGLDLPNDAARAAWRFLIPYVERATEYVFSRPSYAWEGLDEDRMTVIPPSIDAFSPKNQTMPFTGITAVLRAAGMAADHHHPSRAVFERLDGSVGRVEHPATMIEEAQLRLDTPLLAQVSRWDRLKDPLGLLAMLAEHLDDPDLHLVLVGPDTDGVSDDPEGAAVYGEVTEAWRRLDPEHRRRAHLLSLPMHDIEENAAMVNAIQRRADVVLQKSIAEGFGLTVAEAMWKRRPVVGSRVGGIQDQVEDGGTGILIDDPHDLAACAAAVRTILADPARAEAMGEAARQRVIDRYLAIHRLREYVELLSGLIE